MFLNDCNINDPSISADILADLKECIYYILQNKVVIPDCKIEMFWNCVSKIIFKINAEPTAFITEINNLFLKYSLKIKKNKNGAKAMKSHLLTAPHHEKFSALLSACEFFYDPALNEQPDKKS